MKFISQENNLIQTAKGANPSINSIFPDTSLIEQIEEILNLSEITYSEIGDICELIELIVKREIPVESFEEKIIEKLDEDNRPKAQKIVFEINDKIFSKLLPPIGIKPLSIAKNVVEEVAPNETSTQTEKESKIPTMAVNDSGIEFNEQENTPVEVAPAEVKERPVPIKKVVTESPKPATEIKPSYVSNTKDFGFENFQPNKLAPVPPQPLSEFSTSKVYKPASPVTENVPTDTRSGLAKPPIVELNSEKMSENPLGSFLKMLSGRLSERELQARFDKLPYTLKNALRSVDSAKQVLDIGRKYALHVDKLGELGEETGMVILGITQTSQFLPRLSRRLGISEEKTKLLAQEINNEVFLKIREALKQVNGEIPSSYSSNTLKTRLTPLQPTPPEPVNKSNDEVLPDREAILKDIENPNSSTSEDTEKFTATDWFKSQSDSQKVFDTNAVENNKPTPPKAPVAPKFVAPPQAPVKNVMPPVPPKPQRPVAPIPTTNKTESDLVKTIPTSIPPMPPRPEIKTVVPPTVPKIVIPVTQIPKPQAPVEPPKNTTSQTKEMPKIVIGARPMQAKNIIEQKLSSPVQSTKTETKYSSDPYREPIA